MDELLLATGFTGGLTFLFLARLLYRRFADAAAVTPCFSPKGGCTDAVVRELKRARKEVLVLAHAFSSPPIAQALLDAKLRGANVEVILDRRNEMDTASCLHLFREQGLAPLLDTRHARAHNSVMVIDGRAVLTGSFDFTPRAEDDSADNLLVVAGHPEVAQAYRKYFLDIKRAVTPDKAAEAEAPAPPESRKAA
jgi:phosphatidylserine/phosphatidylglycerophosphate/cardiolipin synthase-like enzyme